MKINRNEPCPCGSGEKYKVCCENKSFHGGNENRYIRLLISGGLGLFLILTLWGIIGYFNTDHPEMEAYKCDNPRCNQIHYRPISNTN